MQYYIFIVWLLRPTSPHQGVVGEDR
jgi:hypothetical protein